MCRNLRLEAGTDLARLAHLTPGYVGADLTSLTRHNLDLRDIRVYTNYL